MCLGHESLEAPHLCHVAEQVFAGLPWPCLVRGRGEGSPVIVNEAFRHAFGLDASRVGPRWLSHHTVPARGDEELVHADRQGVPRRYRLTRRVFGAPPAAFDAVFLMPLPDDEAPGDEPSLPTLTALRPAVSLTRRESQVLDGIMGGKLNKVIAGELDISPKTVELHRANLMTKLRVHNVVELARAVLDSPPGRGDRQPA